MTADILLGAFGMALLLLGGELLVRGAARLARSLGISPLAVGLTVVAFGTSSPEMAVNVLAAWRDSGGLSFGNIIGSNLANIGLIFGLTALLQPIPIENVVVRREMPMMLLATAAAMCMAFDPWFAGRTGFFDRGDGVVLLLFFVVFVYYTLGDVLRQRRNGNRYGQVESRKPPDETLEGTTRGNLMLVFAGLVLLVMGADVTIDAAVSLARALGVSEVVIGLTLVAVGTSLPELVATGVAVVRGQSSMAVGNVVGSNIFNLLLVGGVTSVVRPIPIPEGAVSDLFVLAGLSVLLWGVSQSRGQIILRMEAAALLSIYSVYMVFRTFG